jgi:hypothetical protein
MIVIAARPSMGKTCAMVAESGLNQKLRGRVQRRTSIAGHAHACSRAREPAQHPRAVESVLKLTSSAGRLSNAPLFVMTPALSILQLRPRALSQQ